MSRTLRQLTIFISGTDEADAEKAALRRLTEELNKHLEKTQGVTLRVIGWPDDVRPGVNVDAQAEISRQVGPASDIYLGLLGTRFGTATPRAGSGTEEEFEAALARFRSDSASIRVPFYFKRATENPFTMDIDQLEKVKRFRETLSSRGVLYRDFRDTTDFVKLIQDHLYNLVIDEWKGSCWLSVPLGERNRSTSTVDIPLPSGDSGLSALPAFPSSRATLDDSQREVGSLAITDAETEEELGFLDYVAAAVEEVDALTKSMTQLRRHVEHITEQICARTAETACLQQKYQQVKDVGGSRAAQEFIAQTRSTVDHAAANLDEFVNAMASDVEQYRLHSHAMFAHFLSSLKAAAQVETSSQNENRTALAQLIEALHQSRKGVSTFQSTISQVPALTGKFKRARKRTAAILGEFVAEITLTIGDAERLLEELGSPPTKGAAGM